MSSRLKLFIIFCFISLKCSAQRNIEFFEQDFDSSFCQHLNIYSFILPAEIMPVNISQFFSKSAPKNNVKRIEIFKYTHNTTRKHIENCFYNGNGYLIKREIVDGDENMQSEVYKYYFNRALQINKIERRNKTVYYFNNSNIIDSMIIYDNNGINLKRVYYEYNKDNFLENVIVIDSSEIVYMIIHERVLLKDHLLKLTGRKILNNQNAPDNIVDNKYGNDSVDLFYVRYNNLRSRRVCLLLKKENLMYFLKKDIHNQNLTSYQSCVYIRNYVSNRIFFHALNTHYMHDNLFFENIDDVDDLEYLYGIYDHFFLSGNSIYGKKSFLSGILYNLPVRMLIYDNIVEYNYIYN